VQEFQGGLGLHRRKKDVCDPERDYRSDGKNLPVMGLPPRIVKPAPVCL